MEKEEFLEQNIFTGLNNLNDSSNEVLEYYFSEADFETILERIEHFGIGAYKIEAKLDGKPFDVITHEDHKKKATDPKWYTKAFTTFKHRQAGLSYFATYKVSKKLLARES